MLQRQPEPQKSRVGADDDGPLPTRLDVHGSLFGVPIRVHPLFWLSAAATGWGAFADPDHGNLGFLLLWIVCVVVSLLVHELAHVAVARMFGVRLGIVLGVLGSWTSGTEALTRRGQRILVRLAGLLPQVLILGAIWALTSNVVLIPSFVQEHDWLRLPVANGLYMLFLINLAWLMLNIVPLWPLDGGYLLRDFGEAVLGPRGRAAALGACLAVPLLLAFWIGREAYARLDYMFDPRGAVVLQMCGLLLLFCAMFFLRAFGALHGEYRQWQSGKDTPRGSGETAKSGNEPARERESQTGVAPDGRSVKKD